MKIEKTECSYQVTECDLKFGKQITLDGEVLIPASVIDKIRAEIEKWHKEGTNWSDIRLMKIEDILDKHKAESEGKE